MTIHDARSGDSDAPARGQRKSPPTDAEWRRRGNAGRCGTTTRAGTRCRINALIAPDGQTLAYCHLHNPAGTAQENIRARRQAAKSRRGVALRAAARIKL